MFLIRHDWRRIASAPLARTPFRDFCMRMTGKWRCMTSHEFVDAWLLWRFWVFQFHRGAASQHWTALRWCVSQPASKTSPQRIWEFENGNQAPRYRLPECTQTCSAVGLCHFCILQQLPCPPNLGMGWEFQDQSGTQWYLRIILSSVIIFSNGR